jgi:hypothetical protein
MMFHLCIFFSHFLKQCILFKYVGNNNTQVKEASLFHLLYISEYVMLRVVLAMCVVFV